MRLHVAASSRDHRYQHSGTASHINKVLRDRRNLSRGIGLAALGLARAANAASAGPATVDQTVSQLQADGHRIILNKFGTAPHAPSVRSDPARPTPEPIPVYRGPA